MMAKIYHVDLAVEERQALLRLIRTGKSSARKINRARILLLADEGRSDQEIQEVLHTSAATVGRTRKRLVEGNLEYALDERKRCGAPRKLDARQEAYLIALACSEPPPGRARWTLQLLCDKLVELGVVHEISDETVRLRLKKTRSSRG
jgi:transposase